MTLLEPLFGPQLGLMGRTLPVGMSGSLHKCFRFPSRIS